VGCAPPCPLVLSLAAQRQVAELVGVLLVKEAQQQGGTLPDGNPHPNGGGLNVMIETSGKVTACLPACLPAYYYHSA
jgi:hypothetical protein